MYVQQYLNSGEATSILASWGSSGNSDMMLPTWGCVRVRRDACRGGGRCGARYIHGQGA